MLGQSFAPLGDPQTERMQGQGTGPVNPVQEAIKVLSLKIPRATGAGQGAIPTGLMMGQGAAGLGGDGSGNPLMDLLRNLLGGMPAGPIPSPRVIPGIDTGEPAPGTFNPGLGGPPENVSPPPIPAPGGGRGGGPRPGPGTGRAIPRGQPFGA